MTIHVAALYISPVKSLALQRVDRASVVKTGLQGDRQFFLVTDRNRLFTMREYGPLATVRATYALDPERLRIEFPDGVASEGAPAPGDPLTARFFGEYDVEAFETPGPWNDAFAKFIGMSVRLVRAAPKRAAVDVLPVSVLSAASVEELRRTSGEPSIDERRFRPNIYVSGAATPHEEDSWIDRSVRIGGRIGGAVIRVRMRDERCMVTTLNPDTGLRDLSTLTMIAGYRTDQSNEVNFGVYATVEQEGDIAVGDTVEPLS
ncbi:MAG: MOSC domain-containing protein [Chloroflexi bacterium]|nr:MOSC domain-containing protein [Chloroflexota bacterium]